MVMTPETFKFAVDGHKYAVKIAGEFIDLILIDETYDPFAEFGEFHTTTETVNKGFPAIRVFKHVVEIIESWVFKERPPYFAFSTDDTHKADVYEKIAARYAAKHPKFPYTMMREGDRFWFYRKVT